MPWVAAAASAVTPVTQLLGRALGQSRRAHCCPKDTPWRAAALEPSAGAGRVVLATLRRCRHDAQARCPSLSFGQLYSAVACGHAASSPSAVAPEAHLLNKQILTKLSCRRHAILPAMPAFKRRSPEALCFLCRISAEAQGFLKWSGRLKARHIKPADCLQRTM